jgi:hypothetical protein
MRKGNAMSLSRKLTRIKHPREAPPEAGERGPLIAAAVHANLDLIMRMNDDIVSCAMVVIYRNDDGHAVALPSVAGKDPSVVPLVADALRVIADGLGRGEYDIEQPTRENAKGGDA